MYKPSLSSANKHASNGFVTSGISNTEKTKEHIVVLHSYTCERDMGAYILGEME